MIEAREIEYLLVVRDGKQYVAWEANSPHNGLWVVQHRQSFRKPGGKSDTWSGWWSRSMFRDKRWFDHAEWIGRFDPDDEIPPTDPNP